MEEDEEELMHLRKSEKDIENAIEYLLQSPEYKTYMSAEEGEGCSICMEPFCQIEKSENVYLGYHVNAYSSKIPVKIANCGHVFHRECLKTACESSGNRLRNCRCPLCRENFSFWGGIFSLYRKCNDLAKALNDIVITYTSNYQTEKRMREQEKRMRELKERQQHEQEKRMRELKERQQQHERTNQDKIKIIRQNQLKEPLLKNYRPDRKTVFDLDDFTMEPYNPPTLNERVSIPSGAQGILDVLSSYVRKEPTIEARSDQKNVIILEGAICLAKWQEQIKSINPITYPKSSGIQETIYIRRNTEHPLNNYTDEFIEQIRKQPYAYDNFVFLLYLTKLTPDKLKDIFTKIIRVKDALSQFIGTNQIDLIRKMYMENNRSMRNAQDEYLKIISDAISEIFNYDDGPARQIVSDLPHGWGFVSYGQQTFSGQDMPYGNWRNNIAELALGKINCFIDFFTKLDPTLQNDLLSPIPVSLHSSFPQSPPPPPPPPMPFYGGRNKTKHQKRQIKRNANNKTTRRNKRTRYNKGRRSSRQNQIRQKYTEKILCK